MDDLRCREFFSQPTQPYHRQYEALRAVFLEGHSQKEVADRFGYTYDSFRQLVHEFRQQDAPASASAPFFVS
jgi:transposase